MSIDQTILPFMYPAANEIVPAEKSNYLFDRIELPAKGSLPKGLDLSGSIAITRDKNHLGWLHQLIYIAQKISAWLFNRKADHELAHGMIVLQHDKNPNKKDHLIIAHSVFDGVHTSSRNYLADEYVTHLIIYIPKDKKLRELLVKYGNQTAYNPKVKGEDGKTAKKLPEFSICDMIRSLCYNRRYTNEATRSEKVMHRISGVVTDLLLGNQILNKKNRIRNFFCMPYASTILQGSILINSMSQTEIDSLKGNFIGPDRREKIAKVIFNRISNKNMDDSLSRTFWENRLCRWNTRFIMSSTASATLDRVSEPLKLT
jgi:hypothetical protein